MPEESDLAHLDERRLEYEYYNMKRKAELYAVEAKQTAQRLSAENAKLREDLNKERKYNELTRANIVREFEHKVSHGGEKSAKMDVFEKEIEERAHQFLRRMPQEKGRGEHPLISHNNLYRDYQYNILTLKTLEWPGDEAICTSTYLKIAYSGHVQTPPSIDCITRPRA